MNRIFVTLFVFVVLASCAPPPQGPMVGSRLEAFVGVSISEASEVEDEGQIRWLPIANIGYWVDADVDHSDADLISAFADVHGIVVRSNDGKFEVLVWRGHSTTLGGAQVPSAQGRVIDVTTFHDTERLCLAIRVDSVAAASLHRISVQRIGSPLVLVVDGEAIASEPLSTAVGSSLAFCGRWSSACLEQLKQSIVVDD